MATDTTAPGDQDADTTTTTDTPPAGDDMATDAGKRALDVERRNVREARAEARKLAAELEALKAQTMTETERAIAAARAEAVAEVTKEWSGRLVKSDIRAAAAGRFANPDDALLFVDAESVLDVKTGEVNQEALSSAIDAALKERPYLAAVNRGKPSEGDGGPRGSGKASETLTNDVLRSALGR